MKETRQQTAAEKKKPVPVSPAHRKPANGNGQAKAKDEGLEILHELLEALEAMRVGDFSARMETDHVGLTGKIADTFNEIIRANERMAQQLERVGEVVGREGKTKYRVKFVLSGGA